jgi:hypothetical protein
VRWWWWFSTQQGWNRVVVVVVVVQYTVGLETCGGDGSVHSNNTQQHSLSMS